MLAGEQAFAYAFFTDEAAAAKAVQALIDKGFATEHVGALMIGPTGRVQDVPLAHKTPVGSGAVIGAVLGAAVGAVALPAVGLMAFGAFGAAAAGGLTGTIAGSLGGLGLWKDEVDFPKATFERGDVLIGTLTPSERGEEARTVLAAAGGQSSTVSTHAKAARDLAKHGHAAGRP